ncbi:heat shock 70 kDa protein 12A-like [Mya arenaria]|uniref:heat shock 70 kDa protein 12A-like n=1 Tax=Mya arenaria TaxID=6604 RepID=UPI0022E3DD21|nr:heat shock 70 kDa protein 12A-like [Mya arenaria]
MQEQERAKQKIVVAFDFGTTYSGYAFSHSNNPFKVGTFLWKSGQESLISQKTPTSILLNPEGSFHSFGFEAEDKFANLSEAEEHGDWRLFRQFKMLLLSEGQLKRSTTIADVSKKKEHEMPAIEIFAMSIQYLKDHFLEQIKSQGLDETSFIVQYVLTVPAIWGDKAKAFMREAAMKAGIDSDSLTLALEPEVASIWCKSRESGSQYAHSQEAKISLSGEGTRYMVVDLGGGTADICIHEINKDGLKQIGKASGGPWGGTNVDRRLLKFFKRLVGTQALEALKDEGMNDYFDLIRCFEASKREFDEEANKKMSFKVPGLLQELCERFNGKTLSDRVEELFNADKVEFKRDKIRIHSSEVAKWFDAPISSLVKHIRGIFEDRQIGIIHTIVLVGGFSESPFVQNKIKRAFSNRRVIVPYEAGLAVLKGAVIFGHNPDAVTSRVLKYTYGISVDLPFDEEKHSEESKFFKRTFNAWRAKDCFKPFARVNDEVKYADRILHKFAQRDCWSSCVRIYRSTEHSPIYVTDPGCEYIGKVEIEHSIDYVTIEVTLLFGTTELMVKARLKESGRERVAVLQCLEQ